MPIFSLPPGAPQLPSGYLFGPPPLLIADAPLPATPTPAPWGLYLNGAPAITGADLADTVVAFDFRRDALVPDFPIEPQPGEPTSFASYDKVILPWDVRLQFATGGTEADRQALLDAVEQAYIALDLYDVYTPERRYPNSSVVHYNYRRIATNGVGMILVDVWLIQANLTGQGTFTNTQQPDGADPQNGGIANTQAPTANQTAFATTAV